jgi:hypothetical protein
MTAQRSLSKSHNNAPMPNALVPLSAGTDQPALVTRGQLARQLSLSCRSVDNLQKQRKIPFIRISRRCVRFHVPSVLTALRRFEVREIGR